MKIKWLFLFFLSFVQIPAENFPLLDWDQVDYLEKLLEMDESEMDYTDTILRICQLHTPELNREKYIDLIGEMAREIKIKIKRQHVRCPLDQVEILNEYLFKEKKFVYTSSTSWNYFLLNRVLDGKRGHCLGLSILYICLGQRLGLPIHLVSCYKHAYAQCEYEKQGLVIRMEMFEQGGYFEESLLLRPENVPGKESGQFFRSHTPYQVIGIYLSELALYYLTDNCEDKKKVDRASVLIHLAARFYPDSYRIFSLKGVVCYLSDLPESAVYFLEKAVALNGADKKVVFKLFELYCDLGQMRKALNLLSRAEKYDPRDAQLLGNIGYCYLCLKKYDLSIEYSLKALRFFRDLPCVYSNLYKAYLAKKDYFRAQWAAKKVIALSNRSLEGYVKLAQIYLKVQRPDKVKRVLKKLVEEGVDVNTEKNKDYKKDYLDLLEILKRKK